VPVARRSSVLAWRLAGGVVDWMLSAGTGLVGVSASGGINFMCLRVPVAHRSAGPCSEIGW